ncbi:5'-nucleotidase C-terminal domain-containing protein [Tepidibacter thalassicus]|uniref:2',3'-cyclic-nucleotide 2'-phosphodiesterase / 3'-nucleotidase n=1 Tax=Tepidibacter thalassicus DSM 15285 TaxID=1123350 RepID=A0A1M5PCN9_9FIRM|nr:5'-nucleotidase C-terminal domain-containing protein [Tepidibacter thalassicus]SHG99505.1 2',3'-cyclic-nucleotide 2'-phosphodiesterase / 3'-nucleotidase [Tepidibacter thalassicus DSM 15285]
MNSRKRLISYIVSFLMILTMFGQVPVAKAANEVTIDILQINDFHGSLKESGKNVGAAKLVNAIKKAKESNPNTIVLSAGDNFNGSAVSNLLYGEPVAKMMKEAGIMFSAVGNHEFDWGLDKIQKWEEISGIPFLAANIYDKNTNKPVTWADPYKIVDVDGIKVGIIGLTTQETAYKTKPQNVESLEFKNPAEIAKKIVPKVKEEGADIVLLLTHIGAFQDKQTKAIKLEVPELANIKDVDGIILGHSHQKVAGMVNGIPVVQGYKYGRALGKISFTVDKDTKKIIKKESSLDLLYERKDLKDDEAVKKIVDEYTQKVGPILDEVIGKTVNELDHDRYKLSTLGEWTTDVMKQLENADIAVTNGGGLRTSIPAGDITVGKMYEVMPFDNVLSSFEMTGKQIKEIFEHGIENEEIGSVQFSGVKVEYIPGAKKGNKVVKMILDNGEEVDLNKTYKVVTNDFMASGGDGYTVFKEAKALGETIAIRDALIEAVKKAKVLDYKKQDRLIAKEVKTEQPKVQEPKAKVEESKNKNVVVYVVKKGDALYKIGKKYNVKWQKIAKFNSLKNPNLIFPGQQLSIPVVN